MMLCNVERPIGNQGKRRGIEMKREEFALSKIISSAAICASTMFEASDGEKEYDKDRLQKICEHIQKNASKFQIENLWAVCNMILKNDNEDTPVTKITRIQKIALEALLVKNLNHLSGLDYPYIFRKRFGKDKYVPNVNDLSYYEAKELIMYINALIDNQA
jgi:hypothetical protein